MNQEKINRILEEMKKIENKTTASENNIVQEKISAYQKLSKQLSDTIGNHSTMLKQVRSQPIDVLEKLLEQIKS